MKTPTNNSTTLEYKPVYAAYLNMARQNFVNTIIQILSAARIKSKVDIKDNSLNDLLLNYQTKFLLKDDEYMRFSENLYRHFPALAPIMAAENAYELKKAEKNKQKSKDTMRSAKKETLFNVLYIIAQTLTDLRNFYTHFNPYNSTESLKVQYKRQTKTITFLKSVMDASRRIDKKRKDLNPADYNFITGNQPNFGKKRVPKKDENGVQKLDKRGKPIFSFEDNPAFSYCLFKTINEPGEGTDRQIKVMSDFGIVYFTSLFLHKKYIQRFVKESKILAATDFGEKENGIIQDMLMVYRYRPVKVRIDSHSGDMALGLDMLNELRRCPRELFDVLSAEGKNQFRVGSEEQTEDDGMNPDSYLLLRSKEDRFTTLALSYIDQCNVFNKIRFQISLGKYRYKFYDKNCIDSETRVRCLQRDLNGFGRIQEIEKKRKEIWGDDMGLLKTAGDSGMLETDSSDTPPYITDQKARYAINGNRIGLLWYEKNTGEMHLNEENGYCYLPDTNIEKTAKEPTPLCWLSIYDVPAMIFLTMLYKAHGQDKSGDVENIIRKKYIGLRDFFEAVARGSLQPCSSLEELTSIVESDQYNLKINEIPDKIKNYLSGTGTEELDLKLQRHFLNLLKEKKALKERALQTFKDARNKIGTKENTYGKKSYTDIRSGKIAQWLMASIIDWQPGAKDGHNKLTGLNYAVLQAELAMFGQNGDIEQLSKSMSKAGLLKKTISGEDNPYPHPFLNTVLSQKPANIEIFYIKYLEKEIEFLKIYIDNISKLYKGIGGKVLYKRIPFLHHERLRWQKANDDSIRDLASRYCNRELASIQLPSGLFTDRIREKLNNICSNGSLNDEQQAKLHHAIAEGNNAAYMIKTYFEVVAGDCAQTFYDSNIPMYRRNYALFDTLRGKREYNKILPTYLSSAEICQYFTAQDAQTGKRQVVADIEKYVAKLELDTNEEKQNEENKLHHKINECKNNEMAIRRYRTQDMLLSLMARDIIMSKQNKDTTETHKQIESVLRLKNIQKSDLLSQTVDYSISVDLDKVKKRTKTIVQHNMKLKNYGEFYKFLSDSRISGLLCQLDSNCIDRAQIESELSIYDDKRIEAFRIVHRLEELVLSKNQILLHSPELKECKTDRDEPIRNSFSAMMNLLKDVQTGEITKEDTDLLIQVRNAFSHNKYLKDLKAIAEHESMTLPNIARLIVEKMNEIAGKCK